MNEIEPRCPAAARHISHLRSVHTGSEVRAPSSWTGANVRSSEVKLLASEADHSPLSSAEIKNEWNYSSIPLYPLMSCCLIKHNLAFIVMSITIITVNNFQML
jgi:hypothetical protein